MSDLNIVLGHKDFTFPTSPTVDYSCYTQRDLKCNLPTVKYDGLDDRIYGEFGLWYYLVDKNIVSCEDFVALSHYRRKFENYYHHTSVAKPFMFPGSVLQQCLYYHSVKYNDWFKEILTPQEYNLLANTHWFYPYNIFGVKGDILRQWIDFVGRKLDKLKEITGLKTFEDCCEFVKNDVTFTAPQPNKNIDVVYQARIYATVTERLNTLFWLLYPGEMYHCEVKLLEEGQRI